MTPLILSLILHYSTLYGVDPVLAIAVAQHESNFNVNCISQTSDVGLFQLNTKTFRRYSRKQLLDPKLNIKLGIEYLALQRDLSPFHKGFTWLNSYNVGPVANTYKYPEKYKYYKEVKMIYDELRAGDKVVVSGLYNLHIDGEAIYLGLSTDTTKWTKGYYRIESTEGNVIQVHPERVKKCLK